LVKVNESRTLTNTNPEGTAWDRLNKTPTLASSRREIFHHDPQAPNDSLDFVIKSTYDHHKEFLSSRAQTLVQHETADLPHGIQRFNQLHRRAFVILVACRIGSQEIQTVGFFSQFTESHHSASTNGGYSRKHDGGFYTC
ncbi:PREDICTED: uncharacterized protein C1orf194 homolog, partial [Acropora digitifera]|uniref:uncharacterized protein C1orf194 homolog n=1 Tax=Acropora digitifera TaxID=70779 RepID=UPI00077A3AD3